MTDDREPTDHARVLVVGAASGIGAAAVRWLAERGWRVAAADRDAAGLRALDTAGVDLATRVEVDASDEQAVDRAVASAAGTLGGLDALVNCVGTTGGGWRSIADMPVAHIDELYAVNLRSAFLLTRAVLGPMRNQGYGRILHLSSIAGKEGVSGMAAYCATKAGLVGLVKSVAREVATEGITVNALAPAIIRTAMTEAMSEEQYTYLRDLAPMRRAGELDEVAAMIEWIVSPRCSFTTGATFDLSGGRADY